jgi:AcrR family transcriptional regulator
VADVKESGSGTGRARWKQNPEAVKENILRVAEEVFAEHGLSGARVAEIAARTETSKRMIYYYFGDKQGLYRSTLEEAYHRVRSGEEELHLDGFDPLEAMRRLVEFTFDHHRRNPHFVRLVMIENVHNAEYLSASTSIAELNRGAISQLERIIERGKKEGLFKSDLDPLAVHWHISALSFFNLSNQSTFGRVFGERLFDEAHQVKLRSQAVESVLAIVTAHHSR